jgi:hypothetical protein
MSRTPEALREPILVYLAAAKIENQATFDYYLRPDLPDSSLDLLRFPP